MISRKRSLANWIIRLANIIQTIPALAMLSILMLGMGLGVNTVVVTVFLYSLLPIIKNTYTGMIQVDRNILDVGKGMGMTKVQLLYMVELPLSVSVIMAGIRNALVVAIGITAIGAFVGAGGLGDIIIRGTNATDGASIILVGALPTAFMAIITDWVLGIIERRLDQLANIPINKNTEQIQHCFFSMGSVLLSRRLIMSNYTIIDLNQQPHLIPAAAQWFSQKWQIPLKRIKQVCRKC